MYALALITAYSPDCDGCSGIMNNGHFADPTGLYVAADLRYWDFGDKIEICLPDGTARIYTVADTGGKIKGKWRFDVLLNTEQEAIVWGAKRLHVSRLNR